MKIVGGLLTKLYQNTVLIPASKKKGLSLDKEIELAYRNAKDINQITKSLKVNNARGVDEISAKFVKMSTDIIDCHITNITNSDIFDNVKIVTTRRIF